MGNNTATHNKDKFIPVQTNKKKGSNSSYAPKQMNYVGSLAGSLQDAKNGTVDHHANYNKSPMLHTGKKMSNTSL